MSHSLHCALVHVSRGVDATPVSPVVDHLGIACLTGALRAAGHAATVYDGMPMGMDEGSILRHLKSLKPDIVGFALNYSNVAAATALALDLTQCLPSVPLFAGGQYATFHYTQLLAEGSPFCAVVLGEGEVPIVRMAQAGAHPRHWQGIPGVAVRHEGHMLLHRPEPAPELHRLAPRALDAVSHLAHFPHECARVAVEFSRGCTHACRFCSIAAAQSLAGQHGVRRTRTPESMLAELVHIVETTGLRSFWFMDADMLGPAVQHESALQLARLLHTCTPGLSLEMDTRADAVTPEIIEAWRRAGLERCFLGVESFDSDTLQRFSKGSTPEGNLQAVRVLEEQGVRPILGMIMFHPQSTVAQLRRDHAALRDIGYEKTQMLFRLKKYKGSRDAGPVADSDGKGVAPWADYGWDFTDPTIQELWDAFDALRLAALDTVFVDMTQALHQGQMSPGEFQHRSDAVFHDFGRHVDRILG